MSIFGCLPILLIVLLLLGLTILAKSIEMLGATAVWIWESFLNLFRSAKKEVRNPWTGITNFEKEDILRSERQQENQFEQERQKMQTNEDGTRPKLYEEEDGEYIDFKEL
ncbi:MAG: DUF4834 family protein [Bacteroidales bacterium]|nr:DUF4834 family protein [Bacteroidales bacterium]